MIDLLVVGAGAAGLATAIFAARRLRGRSIVALDGAARLGAKILVAGGGRCNVTNANVSPADYWGGSPHTIRRVLAALPVAATVEFFREIGVALHEEEHGKLFPDTHRARTVLDALLREAERLGVTLMPQRRVTAIDRRDCGGFRVVSATGELEARRIVLATGGLSLPKTGSDGGGYALAQRLGHTLVPTTPALAPFVLDGAFHPPLAGIAHRAALTIRAFDRRPLVLRGDLLWTHFGVSGPLALNASRHWHRARLTQRDVPVQLSFLPDDDYASVEQRLLDAAGAQPRVHLRNLLGQWLPARLGEALLNDAAIDGATPLAHVSRAVRRTLGRALLERPLPIRDSRGYTYAEATAGGVPLSEIDAATMESEVCPGLHLVGEILDVDGRIGGFNFQWAWASGFVAAGGAARGLTKA
ncbi:MAG: NAD(P)/FAD-dependent oxidoreductase [Phycisphaerae bacterium]